MIENFASIVNCLKAATSPKLSSIDNAKRAAVAIALRDGAQGCELLMIQRAVREGDPWSGHMGFPGGRREPGDSSNLDCALRETREEIGADYQAYGELLCQLSDVNTGWRADRPEMLVAPFVFSLSKQPLFSLNHEVDSVLWVPISFLLDSSNRSLHQWQWRDRSLETDCYHYEGRLIWGLSLMMIDELLEIIRI